MFIRLKKRKQCKVDALSNDVNYSIVVVESFWDDAKKPRQKFIKHLGSIKESELLNSSAYNEHINEIMSFMPVKRRSNLLSVGERVIDQDEFKKLIYTAFTKLGNRLVDNKF